MNSLVSSVKCCQLGSSHYFCLVNSPWLPSSCLDHWMSLLHNGVHMQQGCLEKDSCLLLHSLSPKAQLPHTHFLQPPHGCSSILEIKLCEQQGDLSSGACTLTAERRSVKRINKVRLGLKVSPNHCTEIFRRQLLRGDHRAVCWWASVKAGKISILYMPIITFPLS